MILVDWQVYILVTRIGLYQNRLKNELFKHIFERGTKKAKIMRVCSVYIKNQQNIKPYKQKFNVQH